MQVKPFSQRIIFIISWHEKGEWGLVRDFQRLFERVDVLQPLGLGTGMPRVIKSLSSKLAAVYLPLWTLLRYNKYDLVVSYSIRSGTVFGVLKRIMGSFISMPLHIVRDFHINLAEADIFLKRLKYAILGFATPGMDMILTTSRQEIDIYSELFKIPQNRVRFYPDGAPTYFLQYNVDNSAGPGSHVFSYGNSDRDYDVLIMAIKNLHVPCIILSQNFNPSTKLPHNVKLIRDRVSLEEMTRLILESAVTVISTHYYNVAAGQNGILEAMSLGRPVVSTENFASLEYGKDGESIILVPPADPDALRKAIKKLLENPDLAASMGRKAREFALESSAGLMDIFCEYIEDILPNMNKGELVQEIKKIQSSGK